MRLPDLIAFAVAIVIVAVVGFLNAAQSQNTQQLLAKAPTQAARSLESLPITDNDVKKNQTDIPRYKRDQFGTRWADVNHTGCDTRNEILARDLTDVVYKPGTHDCVVLSGKLADPYTGKNIDFVRGQGTSEKVQIDHVVALKDAWVSGAWAWDTPTREQFANDPLNLMAVDGPANQAKSDLSADGWLPDNREFHCRFAVRQVVVKEKWGLSVTSEEKHSLAKVLSQCDDAEVEDFEAY